MEMTLFLRNLDLIDLRCAKIRIFKHRLCIWREKEILIVKQH